MRLSILGPGHVLLQSPRGARRAAFAVATATFAGAVQLLLAFGSSPPAIAAVGFAGVLLALTFALLLRHCELELQHGTLHWRRRGVLADTVIEAPRSALRHLRMRGIVATQRHQHGESRSMRYLLELIAEHHDLPPCLELARQASEVTMRRFAERLARAADLPLLDAIGDDLELRAPDALDAPPRSRSPLPALAPTAIALRQGSHGPEASTALLLQRRRRRLLPAMGIAALGFAVAAGVAVSAGGKGMPAAVWLLFLVTEAMLLAVLLVLSRRRQRVFVHDGELHVVHDLLGLPLRHRRLPTAAIERVRLQSATAAAPQLHSGLAVVSDDEIVVVGNNLDAADLRWLQAWVEQQVWPTLPVQASDSAPPAC